MLFRVITIKVLENVMRKLHQVGRWTIFDTRLMLFRVLTLETKEHIMRNQRQHSGVNFREKKYASRRGPVNICSLDGHILADVWQKLFTPPVRWKKVCFPLGTSEHLQSGWYCYCRRFLSAPKVRHQLLLHVCSNNANWFSKCRWSAVKRMISFQLPKCVTNFCHTSAVIMQVDSWNVNGLQWNVQLFLGKMGGELLLPYVCSKNDEKNGGVYGLQRNWCNLIK